MATVREQDGIQISDECVICCEKCTDKAFVNDCMHYFCFNCILQWIKVRAVCPLCVQPVNSIINNVRSVDDYDIRPVEPPANDVLATFVDSGLIDLWTAIDDSESELSSEETAPIELSSESDDEVTDTEHDDQYEDPSSESDEIIDTEYEDRFDVSANQFSSGDEEDISIPGYDGMDYEHEDEDLHYSSISNYNVDEYETDQENEGENEFALNYSSNESETNDNGNDYTYTNFCDEASSENNSDLLQDYDNSDKSEPDEDEYQSEDQTDSDDYCINSYDGHIDDYSDSSI